jgi:hypothetical protein
MMIRMIRLIFYSLFLTAIFSRCVSQNSSTDELFDMFGSEFTEHFPKKQPISFLHEVSFYPSTEGGFEVPSDMLNAGAFIRRSYELGDEVISLINSISFIGSSIHKDSDCFTCNRLRFASSCKKFSFPLPTFYHEAVQLFNTEKYLPDDFIIYVIAAEPGIFLPEENLIKTTCEDEKWNHGYSRGIAISEKRGIAIYWLEMW